jgi:hypothetical protein
MPGGAGVRPRRGRWPAVGLAAGRPPCMGGTRRPRERTRAQRSPSIGAAKAAVRGAITVSISVCPAGRGVPAEPRQRPRRPTAVTSAYPPLIAVRLARSCPRITSRQIAGGMARESPPDCLPIIQCRSRSVPRPPSVPSGYFSAACGASDKQLDLRCAGRDNWAGNAPVIRRTAVASQYRPITYALRAHYRVGISRKPLSPARVTTRLGAGTAP